MLCKIVPTACLAGVDPLVGNLMRNAVRLGYYRNIPSLYFSDLFPQPSIQPGSPVPRPTSSVELSRTYDFSIARRKNTSATKDDQFITHRNHSPSTPETDKYRRSKISISHYKIRLTTKQQILLHYFRFVAVDLGPGLLKGCITGVFLGGWDGIHLSGCLVDFIVSIETS